MPYQTVLKVLLRERHIQEHRTFCREYNKVARGIDPELINGCPSKATFYRWLAGDLQRFPHPGSCRVLEKMFLGWNVADLFKQWESSEIPEPPSRARDMKRWPVGHLLSQVPSNINVETLNGFWVTVYRFHEFGRINHHADISHVTSRSFQEATITNYTPVPRSEGHAPGFCNIIEVQLLNRHMLGFWKNVNDNYYFGSLHLAILPGENVIEGYYTGFTNDMDVVTERWKWVRLDPASLQGVNLEKLSLQEPSVVYSLVESHLHVDGPIKLAAVTEES